MEEISLSGSRSLPSLAMSLIMALPPELLETICFYLEPNDLKNFGLTCKIVYKITSSELLWQGIISRKYRIYPRQYTASTARAFYQRILLPYAPMLGLWIMEFSDYGGLMRVFVENGCIIGKEIFAPPWDPRGFQSTSKKRIFSIQPEEEEEEEEEEQEEVNCRDKSKASSSTVVKPSCVCLLGADENPSLGCVGSQPMLIFHVPDSDRLHIRCLDQIDHARKMSDMLQTHNFSMNRSYKRWMANWFSCECARVHLQSTVPLVPPFTAALPAPGFFAGDYGRGHGVEMVYVRYSREESGENPAHILEGFKLTGDPNIPKQKITFRAFLDQPVRPSEEQQKSLEALESSEPVPVESLGKEDEFPLKFYLPDDVRMDMERKLVPNHCLARFRGETQIAQHGYREPSFTKSEVVIFDQSLLGIFIFALNNFMLCQRFDAEC